MTPQDLKVAAQMIRGILKGKWTADAPTWVDRSSYRNDPLADGTYTRAVQTAEFLVMLGHMRSPGFDEAAFLKDCGLVP